MIILILLILVSVSGWGILISQFASGQRRYLLPFEPRGWVGWGLFDVVIAIAMLIGLGVAAVGVLVSLGLVPEGVAAEDYSADQQAWLILGSSLATIVTTLASMTVIAIRTGFDWRGLGFSRSKIAQDIVLGIKAFGLLAGPVYLIQILMGLWGGQETKHPLVELVKNDPNVAFLVLSFFTAVVVAPFCEEYLFRVLLQGWLEKLVFEKVDGPTLLAGGPSAEDLRESQWPDISSGARAFDEESPTLPDSEETNPYAASELPADLSKPTDSKHLPVSRRRFAPAPILASSTIFALMHLTHGPDWVALLVLALGIGYLYQRTHRILPCIVVHFLLNACSVAMLLLSLLAAEPEQEQPAAPPPAVTVLERITLMRDCRTAIPDAAGECAN